MDATLTAFLAYLALVVGIGLWAAARGSGTQEDYFLGGRRLSAFVTALSAVSSGRSSWLLIGATGLTWSHGYSALWYFPGYVAAELLLFTTMAVRLRLRSAEVGAITVPEVLASLAPEGRRVGRATVRRVAAAIVMLFLVTYVSAQLVAGGKALEAMFEVDGRSWGLGLTAGIVLFYTLVGGYRAVAFTDVLQACFMIGGLFVVPVLGLVLIGGPDALAQRLAEIDPELVRWSRGWVPLVGGLAVGLGSFGNPHILVRAMSIDDASGLRRAAAIGTFWNATMALGAFGIGLVGRVLYPDLAALGGDSEHVFTVLGARVSAEYLFAGFSGLLLAALFAAIMSTCDSQLLVIASSLLRDFRGQRPDGDVAGLASSRWTVAASVAIAVALILADPETKRVGTFVLFSWAALGAAFGPPLVALLYGWGTSAAGVVAAMVLGAATVVVWGTVPALDRLVYELVPGFAVALAAVALLRRPAPRTGAQDGGSGGR